MIQQEDNTSAVELVGEIYDMVHGWLADLSSDEEQRLREAADQLYSVASAIDRGNWEHYGHA